MPNLPQHRAWPKSFRLLLLTHCAFAVPLYAQDELDLRYLLFDPVPIAIETSSEQAQDSYAVQELLPRPQGEGIDLQSWLASRYGSAARDQEQLDNDIVRYTNAIATLESQQGPFSLALSEELLGLAAAQAANGDDDTALSLYERALHIIRVNNGLYSPDQQQVVSRIIAMHLARGDLLAANEEQQYLFHLQRRNALEQQGNSLLEPLRHQADWSFFTFSAFTTPNPMYESTPALNLYQSFARNSQELTVFRAQGLLRAQALYQQMIDLIETNDGPTDPKLPPLQLELAVTCFHYLSNFNINNDFLAYQELQLYDLSTMALNPLCSRAGLQALEQRSSILEKNQATPVEQLHARLDLADWLLYFDKPMEAVELIQTQHQIALDAGLAGDALAALLNPPLPVPVPAFQPSAYSRQRYNLPAALSLEFKGYIDVEFIVTPFGATRALEVLGRSPQTPEVVEERLIRHLRRTQFRPRMTQDGLLNPDLARIRYYYTY